MSKIVGIIPAYNEESRLEKAVQDLASQVDDIVIVDDCSTDGTLNIARKQRVYVLHHSINRGQGAALQTGTDFALQNLSPDILVHFDADGQMHAKDIPALIEPILKKEADIVLGSRFLGKDSINMPFSREMTLKAAIIFTRLISGVKLTDAHNGFRVFSKEAAQKVRITIDRMAHASEILDLISMKKIRFTEKPVTISYTEETLEKGQSFFGGFTVLKDFFKNKFFGS